MLSSPKTRLQIMHLGSLLLGELFSPQAPGWSPRTGAAVILNWKLMIKDRDEEGSSSCGFCIEMCLLNVCGKLCFLGSSFCGRCIIYGQCALVQSSSAPPLKSPTLPWGKFQPNLDTLNTPPSKTKKHTHLDLKGQERGNESAGSRSWELGGASASGANETNGRTLFAN